MKKHFLQKAAEHSWVSKGIVSAGIILFLVLLLERFFLLGKGFSLAIVLILVAAVFLWTLWIKKWNIYQFLLPALLISGLLAGFPVIYTVYLSFTNMNGESTLSKKEAKEFLLTKQWHFDDRNAPVYVEFYLPKLVMKPKITEYQAAMKQIEMEYNTLYEMELPVKEEKKREARIDEKANRQAAKLFDKIGLDDLLLVFYPERGLESDAVFLCRLKQDSFFQRQAAAFSTEKILKQELNSFLSDRIRMGEPVGEEWNGETEEEISMELMEEWRQIVSAIKIQIEGKEYFHEFSNKFIHKIPLYREDPEHPGQLQKLSIKEEALSYDQQIYPDDCIGKFVFTKDGKEPDHYEVFQIIFPESRFRFYQWAREDHSWRFVEEAKNRLGFYERVDAIFPPEFLKYIDENRVSPELKRIVQRKIREANQEVHRFNAELGLLTQEFRSTMFRAGASLPYQTKFRFVKLEKDNIDQKRDITPGYRVTIGVRNFKKIIQEKEMQKHYFRMFGWTFTWATLSVVFSFFTGLFFASLLNQPGLKGKAVYRILLLLPYAIPASLSVMLWNIFVNTDFGMINHMIGYPVPWLDHPLLSKITSIIVNVWLSFPYFMIVCLGALQSIEPALYEAASVDGASKTTCFFRITFPLLFRVTFPLLVGYFSYSFHNFTISHLLWGNGNDILISYIYNLANRGGRQFGFASAVSLITFLFIAPITYLQIRANSVFEEKPEHKGAFPFQKRENT